MRHLLLESPPAMDHEAKAPLTPTPGRLWGFTEAERGPSGLSAFENKTDDREDVTIHVYISLWMAWADSEQTDV